MQALYIFLKGLAMGAANVIPGVSGGTIAFITGIYERLLNAIKSFNLKAVKLLFSFRFKEFSKHVDLPFLAPVFAGIGFSIFSLAKLLEYLFCNYELLTMAFFFGLIIASIYSVAKTIDKWSGATIGTFVIGTALAVGLGLLDPASANDSTLYLGLCGVVAICSMILPGISGSYVLLIMGNYILIISAIGDFDMKILIPVMLGSVVGLIAFSHLLSFIFKNYKNPTIGMLSGFVTGSLFIIWPWKDTIYQRNLAGNFVDKHEVQTTDLCHDGVVLGYERYLPEMNTEFVYAMGLVLLGIALVILMDRVGSKNTSKS
jgi:putative membrane protein